MAGIRSCGGAGGGGVNGETKLGRTRFDCRPYILSLPAALSAPFLFFIPCFPFLEKCFRSLFKLGFFRRFSQK